MAKGTLKKIAIGTAIAGAAGYIVGVLSVPKEGKKTRKSLQKTAERNMGQVEKQLKELQAELSQMVGDAKQSSHKMNDRTQTKFNKAMDSAHGTKDKLHQVLSSVQAGKATDKDLAKALEDARHALEHVKKFLKK